MLESPDLAGLTKAVIFNFKLIYSRVAFEILNILF